MAGVMSDFLQYDTAGKLLIDSPQYDTEGRLTQRGMILQGDCYEKFD